MLEKQNSRIQKILDFLLYLYNKENSEEKSKILKSKFSFTPLLRTVLIKEKILLSYKKREEGNIQWMLKYINPVHPNVKMVDKIIDKMNNYQKENRNNEKLISLKTKEKQAEFVIEKDYNLENFYKELKIMKELYEKNLGLKFEIAVEIKSKVII